MMQRYCALEISPYGTFTSRLTSNIATVIPNKFKNPETKLFSDFFFQFQFAEDSDYVMLELDYTAQELYISALLGQSVSGLPFGEDPFLKAMLIGNKADGTDVYSQVAASIGLKRNYAKGATLATIYGCGLKTFTNSLLSSIDDLAERDRVKPLAKIAFETLKGKRDKSGQFTGGLASNFFNWSAANMSQSVPVVYPFRTSFPKTLCPKYMGKKATYCAQLNFPVQSGAATLGLLSIFLTTVTAAAGHLGLEEKVDWRYSTSVHDSYTFLVRKEFAEEFAEIIIKSYLQTWALYIRQLGLFKLPHKFMYDCVVNESRCARKYAGATVTSPVGSWTEIGKQYCVDPTTGKIKVITNPDEMID